MCVLNKIYENYSTSQKMEPLFVNSTLLGQPLSQRIRANSDAGYRGTLLGNGFKLLKQMKNVLTDVFNLKSGGLQAEINHNGKLEDEVIHKAWAETMGSRPYDREVIKLATRMAWVNYSIFKKSKADVFTDLGVRWQDDVAVFDPVSAVYKPGYAILVDHISSSVIVCFRGTTVTSRNFTDLATDLDHELNEPRLGGGYCHSGMLTSATAFITEHTNTVKYMLEKYPEHRLIITGHSLGGGVASLVGYNLRTQFPRLTVFTYGCPCVMSRDLTLECEKFVYTFINGDDIVSRLSEHSMNALLDKLAGKPIRDCTPHTLTPVGKIYQIRFIADKFYIEEGICHENYCKLIINNNIFEDHFMDRYVTSLQYLVGLK